MKNVFAGASLWVMGLFLFLSCQREVPTHVEVRVFDEKTEKPLEEAVLCLYRSYQGGKDQLVDTFLTDADGALSLDFKAEAGYIYMLKAEKSYYQPALAGNGASYANRGQIEMGSRDTLRLYLDPLRAATAAAEKERQAQANVNEVIGQLKAGNWSGNYLPRLSWGDIDALLEVGSDSMVISSFPIKAGSPLRPDSARLGQVALWMIEAIRRDVAKQRKDTPVFLMPPSNVPVLGTRLGNPRLFNSKRALQKAHAAYRRWWEGRKEGDTLRTARQNPLIGSGLSWM